METQYFKTEGHGIYKEPHRRAFYTQLLDFFARQIRGGKGQGAQVSQ